MTYLSGEEQDLFDKLIPFPFGDNPHFRVPVTEA